ncbi:BMP family ABC transporter substrate-binding protein [Myxococcaceae bacterium GXIMD 01537]
MTLRRLQVFALAALLCACTKKQEEPTTPATAAGKTAPAEQARKSYTVGLVIDVGGRGDHSFNDAGLRGLELWSAGKKYVGGRYENASAEELKQSITPDLAGQDIAPLPVTPVTLQSKAPEDYEPNLQLLVDQGAALTVGNGYMLEAAVETVAKANPQARFLLIDSPLLDAQGKPFSLPNVRTVLFREEEGSFLVGALAGLVTKTGKVGFVGGVEVPLIKRFETGFRAGVKQTSPQAAKQLMSIYTGSFNNVATGKQVAADLIAKGADVLYHAAGLDGVGVIQAVKEARAAGKQVFVIGVDSDQSALAPDAVLTSMLKHTDLAVYQSVKELTQGKLTGGEQLLGLKEGGVTYADVRVDFPGKAEAIQKVEALRQRVIAGEIKVPATSADLAAFEAAP